MARRFVLVAFVAAGLAAADLALNARVSTDASDFHQRSQAWSVVALVLLAALLAVGLLPSLVVSLAAGVAAGGVAGNILAARLHGGRVPNPLVVGPIAFNLADLLVVCATPILTVALARVAIRHRSFIDRHVPPRGVGSRIAPSPRALTS
jgi:hypothetical protein